MGKKVAKKVHVKVKATKPAKHTKVTKVTRKAGDSLTTHVYTIQEEITEVIVPVEEIITVETTRLTTINTIIEDTGRRVKKATGAKKVKLMKKLTAAKRNIVDAKKKIAVAKGAQKVVQHAKLVAKRAKKIAKVVKKQTKKVKKTAKKVVKKAKVAKKVTVTKV